MPKQGSPYVSILVQYLPIFYIEKHIFIVKFCHIEIDSLIPYILFTLQSSSEHPQAALSTQASVDYPQSAISPNPKGSLK